MNISYEIKNELVFRIGMWWRIVYGFFRVGLGLALLRLVGMPLADAFYSLMRHELVEDPGDTLVQSINVFLHHQPYTVTYFLASYFLFFGVVDIILSFNLLRHRLWAFPVATALIGLFVLYELYRVAHTHSVVLWWVIFIDVFLMWLIHGEYRKLKTSV